ncbi:PmoA family protein [Neolewinella sp.]|uniref:DUF6807 domain-containing protein n=1 Tax=Neolewinella sp. TaxID=2993543 RepID=UPI003B527E7C
MPLLFLACAGGPPAPGRTVAAPRIEQTADSLRITIAGRPVLTYHLTERLPGGVAPYYARSGFIHPVYSPGGQVVTDDFPAGHAHQHGIFTAWTKTHFRGRPLDFWNQQEELATVRHAELLETYTTDGLAGFRTRLQHVSLADGVVLEEEWHLRVHADRSPYRFDLRSVQTNVTDDTLFLERHIYGGLGVRGHRQWNRADSLHYRAEASFLTDEGLTRLAANHSRPAWLAMYGAVDGGTVGLRVFPDSANFRAPQFVRVHPEMPYFSVTPVVEEGFFIPPGGTYEQWYRFEVFDGTPR